MRKIKFIYYPFLLAISLVVLVGNLSCQSDARTSTRIPPIVNQPKAQWQKDALLSLTDLIGRNIDQDVNYFKRARIYFDQEQYTEALADINEGIEEQENVGDYFLLRGKINREIGALDQALEDAERAEALQQGSPDLYVLLADIWQAKGKFREAGRYLARAMQMTPYDASAYYVKGMLEARQGDTLASLNSFNYAINANPRLLRAYLQSTVMYRSIHDYDRALVVNDKAIKRFPQIPELFYERGEIYSVTSNADTALIFYQKAAKLNPKYTDAFSRMAMIEIGQHRYYNAIAALNQLQKIKPDYPRLNNILGYCYEKAGDYPRAREFYTVSIAANPDDREARNGMWRMRTRESNPLSYTSETDAPDYRLLDTSRIKINMIQPRKTINMKVDSSRKAKIQ